LTHFIKKPTISILLKPLCPTPLDVAEKTKIRRLSMQLLNWSNIVNITSRSYTCGYCGNPLASQNGWQGNLQSNPVKAGGYIYVCHQCSCPTFFDVRETFTKQTPGVVFGNTVKDIPDKALSTLYEEARKCTGMGCFTASVLCCRKMLMHIAVSKGAKEGDSFVSYVDHLANNHFVPPDAKEWVDHIRKKGNEANHEVSIMGAEDAEELLSFVEMLMKVIYEFPATAKRKYGVKP
jgi:uncharacterized protein DUF4145